MLDRVGRIPSQFFCDVRTIDAQFTDQSIDLRMSASQPADHAHQEQGHRNQSGRNTQLLGKRAGEFGDGQVQAIGHVKRLTGCAWIERTLNQCIRQVIDEDQAASCTNCAKGQRHASGDHPHHLMKVCSHPGAIDERRPDDNNLEARLPPVFSKRPLGFEFRNTVRVTRLRCVGFPERVAGTALPHRLDAAYIDKALDPRLTGDTRGAKCALDIDRTIFREWIRRTIGHLMDTCGQMDHTFAADRIRPAQIKFAASSCGKHKFAYACNRRARPPDEAKHNVAAPEKSA
ncbi:hypothetical protein WL02_08805 [Burkholderia ubonensis]|nr:hypothetical protein WL02_08805 [Burkholderia ubonensis]